jgi:hypothetical protein
MIRFIIRKKEKRSNGLETETLYTIDHDLDVLELVITAGGCSEDAYERHELIGVECFKVTALPAQKEGV